MSCTEWKRFCTLVGCATWPLMRYLFLPPMTICLVTMIWSQCSYPTGERDLSALLKVIETDALVTPAWPCLYTSSCSDAARTYHYGGIGCQRRARYAWIDAWHAHDGGEEGGGGTRNLSARARGNEKSLPGRDASHGRRRRIPRRIACTACRVSHLRQVGNAQHEAYRVQDVGFTGPVQAGDGVEQGVERRDNGPLRVGLEAVDAHFLDVHGERTVTSLRWHGRV